MKVSNQKIDELISKLDVIYSWGLRTHIKKRETVKNWLSEVEAEQRSRIAEQLMNDDATPVFLKQQAE